MASHGIYNPSLASPTGAPPPPPPKPYSQDPSRTATPIAATPQQQHSYQYSQAPPPPPHPGQTQSPHPQQSFSSFSSPASNQQNAPQATYQGQAPYQQQQYSNNPQSPPPGSQNSAPQHPSLPTTFDISSSLKSHTTSDLSSILSNSELLSSLAQEHPAYSASIQPLQNQIKSNLALAQQVSALEAQVKSLREQTGQLMLQHTSLQTQWRRKQGEMDEALAPWGPRAMYQRLVAGIGEQEALLRAVYESFLEGGGEGHDYYGSDGQQASEKEVTDWMKRIREGTTVLEKRREMRARWDEGRVGGWR